MRFGHGGTPFVVPLARHLVGPDLNVFPRFLYAVHNHFDDARERSLRGQNESEFAAFRGGIVWHIYIGIIIERHIMSYHRTLRVFYALQLIFHG